jgi:heme O synthase-like polyprenyltransferase
MACSSQAANQLIEVDRDKLMKRTMNRPLPSGAVQRSTVFAGSAFTFLAGAATLASVNTWAAYVGSLTWALYVGVYTPLKTRTVWNTQFGAVVGALPPLLGYAGAVGPTPSAFGLSFLPFGF